MTGRPINEDRQNAIALGLKTYTGTTHVRCGTTERYLNGSCAHCARAIATEQREARKYLQRHAAPGSPGGLVLSDDPEIEVDNPDGDGLDIDEAEARFQGSIDELM